MARKDYTKDGIDHAAGIILNANIGAFADIFNNGWDGLRVDIDTTAIVGTSVTPSLEMFDSAKGDYVSILTGAAITGAGHVALYIDPRMATAANVALSSLVPKRVRVKFTASSLTSWTGSVMHTFG